MFLSKLLHEMCTYVSNYVTEANQSGAVSLFISSFETQEILTA